MVGARPAMAIALSVVAASAIPRMEHHYFLGGTWLAHRASHAGPNRRQSRQGIWVTAGLHD
jgi:hypothetical protein